MSGLMLNDSELALFRRLNNVEPPAGDDEERGHLALLDQHLAFSDFARTSGGGNTLDLRRRQLGYKILAAFRRKGQELSHWNGFHKGELDARRSIKDI